MEQHRRSGVRWHDRWNSIGGQRFAKYAIGSVVAFGASEIAFMLFYGLLSTSPQVASVLAFGVGAPVNYVLNRRWVWQRRGRPTLRYELAPYAGLVSLSILASAVGTWGVDRWLQSMRMPRLAEVVIVATAFALINGGLFLAKYVLLDRWVFHGRSHGSDEALRDVEPVP